MKLLDKLNISIDEGLTKAVFDHVRNYLMCAFLFAAGSFGMVHQSDLFLSQYIGPSTGIAIFILAGVLTILNFYDGVYRMSKQKHHILLSLVLLCIYMLISFRIIELAWGYRISV